MAVQTFDTLLQWGTDVLTSYGVMNASLDAWYLMEHVFDIDRVHFLLTRDQEISGDDRVRDYERFIGQRAQGRPVQYLMGYTEFMGMSFEVNEHVLIPRQDTEVLVETALGFVRPEHRVLDMCTGSGCIILSMAALGGLLAGTGADISSEALSVAVRNRDRHGLHQVDFIESNLFENISGCYDMIVSNPPYIPTGEIHTLMREVRDHEPVIALDGDADGLAFYRRLASEAGAYLTPSGMLLMEIGWNQAEAVTALLREAGFNGIHVKKDLAGLDRVVYAVK